MQPSWSKYLSIRPPRYTSYPSALYVEIEQITVDLSTMEEDGFIIRQGSAITVNDTAHSLSRAVAAVFDPYSYAENNWQKLSDLLT